MQHQYYIKIKIKLFNIHGNGKMSGILEFVVGAAVVKGKIERGSLSKLLRFVGFNTELRIIQRKGRQSTMIIFYTYFYDFTLS